MREVLLRGLRGLCTQRCETHLFRMYSDYSVGQRLQIDWM